MNMSETSGRSDDIKHFTSDIKLISVRKARTGSDNGQYNVHIRNSWRTRRINRSPLTREQAEEVALRIEREIRRHRGNLASEGRRNDDEIILAGNSVHIANRTLISGEQEYLLDDVDNVVISGAPNEDFGRVWAISFLLFVLLVVGAAAIGLFVGVTFRDSTSATAFFIGAVFVCGSIALFAIFLYLFVNSPGVWSVKILTREGLRVVYKSEERRQANRVAEMIRGYLGSNLV